MLADISNVDAIYIVCGRTDMRKSIDGLCAIIQDQFSMEIDNALYLFCRRKCDRIKAILKEPDGIVMIYKRLTAKGSYRWPRDRSEVRNLTWREFDWLMSGIDIEQPKDIQFRELKDMVAELKNLIKTLQETVDAERYKVIPVTKEYLNLEDTKCPVCGADLVSIGEEFVRRELVFIPALNITVSATAARNVKERISLQSKKEKMEKPICCMEWLLRVPLRG